MYFMSIAYQVARVDVKTAKVMGTVVVCETRDRADSVCSDLNLLRLDTFQYEVMEVAMYKER